MKKNKWFFLLIFLFLFFPAFSQIFNLVECTALKIEAFILKQEIAPKIAILSLRNRSLRKPSFLENLYELLSQNLKDYLIGESRILGFDQKGGFFSPPSIFDFGIKFTYSERAGQMILTTRIYDKEGHLEAFFLCRCPVDHYELREFEEKFEEAGKIIPLWETEIPGRAIGVGFLDPLKIIVLFSDRVSIFMREGSRLRKIAERIIEWPQPVYPSLDERGKVFVLSLEGKKHIIVQSSISTHAVMLDASDLTLEDNLNWIPLQQTPDGFLLLAKFLPGRNSFNGKVILIPKKEIFSLLEIQPIELPPFYDICFSGEEFHLIDNYGKHRVFLRDGKEIPAPEELAGDEIECWNSRIITTGFGLKEELKYRDLYDVAKTGRIEQEGIILDMTSYRDSLLILYKKENSSYWLKEFKLK